MTNKEISIVRSTVYEVALEVIGKGIKSPEQAAKSVKQEHRNYAYADALEAIHKAAKAAHEIAHEVGICLQSNSAILENEVFRLEGEASIFDQQDMD